MTFDRKQVLADVISNMPASAQQLLTIPKQDLDAQCQGHKVTYTYWSSINPDSLGLVVFIHGAAAHRKWFDFSAPALTDRYDVIALDLPGMGDSEHWDAYHIMDLTEAIKCVVQGSPSRYEKIWLIGHSFGGSIVMNFALRYPDLVEGIIVADTPIRPPNYNYSTHKTTGPIRKIRLYPDEETILSRYRLTPAQECKHPAILSYVAMHSYFEVDGEFRWKFDDSMLKSLRKTELSTRHRYIESLPKHPSMFIYGEKSYFFKDKKLIKYIGGKANQIGMVMVELPDTEHHLVLDDPDSFINLSRNFIFGNNQRVGSAST